MVTREQRGLLQVGGAPAPETARCRWLVAPACVGVGALFYALCNVSITMIGGRLSNEWMLLVRFGGLFLGSSGAALCAGGGGATAPRRSRCTKMWLGVAGTVSWCINIFFFEALKACPPGLATAIVYIYPLLGAVGAACFLDERLPRFAAATGPLALAGLVVAVLGWPPGAAALVGQSAVAPVGVLWSLIIAWCVASFVLCQRVLSGRDDNPGAVEGVRINSTIGLFALTPLYVLATHFLRAPKPAAVVPIADLPADAWRWAVLMAAATNCGLGLQTYGFQTATSLSSVALVTYVEVPFGYLLQYFVAHEVPTTDQCAGSAVIVAACVAHTLLEARAKAAADAAPK